MFPTVAAEMVYHEGRDVFFQTVQQYPRTFWLETGEIIESFNMLLEFLIECQQLSFVDDPYLVQKVSGY